MPICNKILRAGHGRVAQDQVILDYDGRMLRRKRLETAGGAGFMVDLAETVSLNEGDAFELIDGRVIAVIAADELVAIVTGNLPRLAWHIGNRHTPCEVTATHLVIRRDPVLEQMVQGLGAHVATAIAPFRPEGGAYGFGRTMGHSHA
jgi:urease accessory protein